MKRPRARVRSIWRVLWRSDQLEAEMREEMRFHVEMETERVMREQGLVPEEARRQAHLRRLVVSIFGRVVRQLVLGVSVGSLVSGALFSSAGIGLAQAAALLSAVAGAMLVVGLLAALGPVRRSPRIQANEALRVDT